MSTVRTNTSLRLMPLLVGILAIVLHCSGGENSAAKSSPGAPVSRIKLAVLGMTPTALGEFDLDLWRAPCQVLIEERLKEVKAIRVLPVADWAFTQVNLSGRTHLGEQEVREMGALLKADWIVYGNYKREGETWSVAGTLLSIHSNGEALELSANSRDWSGIVEQLTTQILKALAIHPEDRELENMKKWWTVSTATLDKFGRATMLQFAGKSPSERETLLRQAIMDDPHFLPNYVFLGQTLKDQGKMQEAEQIFRNAVRLRNDFEEAHKWLGAVLRLQRKTQEAEEEFTRAILLEPDDADAFMGLGEIHLSQSLYSTGISELEKAQMSGPDSQYATNINAMLAFAKERQVPLFVVATQPVDFNEKAFADQLRIQLTPEQFKLVTNPLTSTPEMARWARNLTLDTTNDEAKARSLFNELAKRSDGSLSSNLGKIRTAQEVFAAWAKPETAFHCQDYARFYVTLARAVGLKAYDVAVEEAAHGETIPHDCAAVFFGDKALLVDPAYSWFGAPHRKFAVLNDLQATALFTGQLPGLDHSDIARKLAPEIGLVQLNYFEKLVGNNRLKEARQTLPVVEKLETNAATVDYVEAEIALLEGNSGTAINQLLKAVAIKPGESTYYMALGNAYAQQGDLDAAHKSLEDALRCPMVEEETALPQNLIASTNELAAWGRFNHGVGMINMENWTSATDDWDKVIVLKPELAVAYEYRAYARQKNGDTNGAIADIKKSTELKMPPK